MIIQFIHLILLCYGVTDLAGVAAPMPNLAATVWLFLSMLMLWWWLPSYTEHSIRSNRVPSFFKAYNKFCLIIVCWISVFFATVDPLSSIKADFGVIAPDCMLQDNSLGFVSILLGLILYLILLRPFMWSLYSMLKPVLVENQTEADFFRARLTVPIIFFPPVLLWSLLEDLGLGNGMELLAEIKSLALAPVFLLGLYLLAPKLFNWAWHTENAKPELCERINLLCDRAMTKIAGVKIWNTFKEPLPNAAVSGLLSSFRYVFVTDYLLEIFSPEEVESIVGHELGHFKLGHVTTYLLYSIDAILLAILIKSCAIIYFPYFYVHSTLTYCLEIVLFIPVFALTFTAMTRFCERQADAFAVAVTSREYFALALSLLESLLGKESSRFPDWLRTHPRTSERINNVKNNEVLEISSLIRSAKVLRYSLLVMAIALILLLAKPASIVFNWSNLYNAAQAGNCGLVTNLCNSLPEWLKEHPFVLEQKDKVAKNKTD